MYRQPKPPKRDMGRRIPSSLALMLGLTWVATLGSCLLLSNRDEWPCEQDSDCPSDKKCGVAPDRYDSPYATPTVCVGLEHCVTTADCQAGWHCVMRRRECMQVECTGGEEQKCGAYRCDPNNRCFTSCQTGQQCQNGYRCFQGSCVDVHCSSSSECSGYLCDNGFCQALCDAWRSPACAADHECVASACVPKRLEIPSGCASGSSCDAGTSSGASGAGGRSGSSGSSSRSGRSGSSGWYTSGSYASSGWYAASGMPMDAGDSIPVVAYLGKDVSLNAGTHAIALDYDLIPADSAVALQIAMGPYCVGKLIAELTMGGVTTRQEGYYLTIPLLRTEEQAFLYVSCTAYVSMY